MWKRKRETNLKSVGRAFIFYGKRRKLKITVRKEREEDTGQTLVAPRLNRERKKIKSQIN